MFGKKKNEVEVPRLAPMDAKITIDNIRSILSGSEYTEGIDRETTVKLIGELYEYLTCRHEGPISLPAPVNSPEDKYRIIWPEGCKINSRRTSVSSAGSKNNDARDKYALSKHLSSDRAVRRALSVTSSTYSTRYVGIIDEEDEQPLMARGKPPRAVSTHHGLESRTVRVAENLMKPTPSIERFIIGNDDGPLPQPLRTTRTSIARPRLRSTMPERTSAVGGMFADE